MPRLFDTDLLIDYLRNVPDAVAYVESNAAEACVSAINVAELYQGVREGKERTRLARTLSALTILPVTSEIAEQGGIFSRDFRKSHGCGLADCLIATTADLHGHTLDTLNAKHYPMLERVHVPYRKSGPAH